MREPLHIPVPMWLPEEALEHYRELVLAIGAVWVNGEWWLPFYVELGDEVMMPLPFWLSARRQAAETLNSHKEIQLTEDRDLAPEAGRPVNLDDAQVIEKGPDEDAITDTYPDGKGVAEIEAAAVKPDPEQTVADRELDIRRKVEDLDKDRQLKESEAAALAAGINAPCKGCPDPEMEVVDGVPDARSPAPLGRDHAEGRPQTGVAADPDPTAPGSGLKASQLAEVAYNAVQDYKDIALERPPSYFRTLPPKVSARIQAMVADWLRDGALNTASMHERWKSDQLAAGFTVEQDPRLGQSWLEMDPSESRKGLIFMTMLNALVRKF